MQSMFQRDYYERKTEIREQLDNEASDVLLIT